jgi:cytochrome c oxidase subunit IV
MAAHIGRLRVYLGVFLVLMVGTVVTYWAAKQDLGMFNAPVALVIATVKAVFVVLFFMHVKDSDRLTKITVAAGIFWLGILLTLTMTDFLSRTWY